MVEKEFVQGKDVSKYDAWKLILLSDLFPKVKIKTTHRIFTIQTVFSFVLTLQCQWNIHWTFNQGTTAFEDIANGDESSEDDEDEEDDEHETTLTEEEEEEIV